MSLFSASKCKCRVNACQTNERPFGSCVTDTGAQGILCCRADKKDKKKVENRQEEIRRRKKDKHKPKSRLREKILRKMKRRG